MRTRLAWSSIAYLAASCLLLPLVASATTKPTCVISTPPGSIYAGSITRLIWYSEYAEKGFISNGIGEVPVPSGYVDVHPSISTVYTMTVTNSAGSNTCGALVTVVQNPPTLLTYYQPVYQPVIFTPITYSNVYIPYQGYGGYYVPYSPVVTYDSWYSDYPSRSYNQKYDFWADYTQGRSTGPSLFGETYAPAVQQPRREVYIQSLPDGASRSVTRECVDGIGCRITGANQGWTVPDGEPGPLDEPSRRAPVTQPRTYMASDEESTGGQGTSQLLLTSGDAPQSPVFGGAAYQETSLYAEGSYGAIPATYYKDDSASANQDPYLTQVTYVPDKTYSEGTYFSENADGTNI